MTTAEITLSKSQTQAIQAVGQSQGKTQEEVLQEAIEQFLTQHRMEPRLAALRQARGIWRERQDLPDLTKLREEWDRL